MAWFRRKRRRRAALVRDSLREWTPLLGILTRRSPTEWNRMSDRARYQAVRSSGGVAH